MPYWSWIRRFGLIAGLTLSVPQAGAQVARDTALLERLFYVEIAALLCKMELLDETEDALDQAIKAEQRRLRFSERQMAAVYRKVWADVEANRALACEAVRQLDPPPINPEEE